MDLARLLDQPDETIDLGRAALSVARTEYPDLDLDLELARLDALAAQAGPALRLQAGPEARLASLRSFLAGKCGFRGNQDDYYDPRNSFLNEVLNRRTGIPITLSVVYMEVGRRLGLPLYGVGLPGHFLVKYQNHTSLTFLDPFHGGRALSRAECRQIFAGTGFREDMLAAVTKKQIVLRMLNNLRGIYLRGRQFRKALAILDLVLSLTPDSAGDLKQRALVQLELGNHAWARRDLDNYLLLNPSGPDAEEVRRSLQDLKRFSALMN